MRPRRNTVLTLMLALLLITFYVQGATSPLDGTDDGRDAQITREMLARGEWVLPYFNGSPLPWKPMLYHWVSGAASLPVGDVNEFTARLPSILAALLCGLVTFDLGRRLFGSRRAGLLAATVLLTSSLFLRKAVSAQYDMTLTGFTTLAIYAFFRSTQVRSPRAALAFSMLFYAAMGLGTLAKGPVGFLVPAMVAIAHHLSRREWLGILRTRPWWGMVVFLAIAAPWYAATYVRGGKAFFDEIFWHQNFTRFTQAFDHQHGPWFYVVEFMGGSLPWSLFLLPAIPALFLRARRHAPPARMPGDPSARVIPPRMRRRSRALFPLVWFVVIFAFFSVSSSKRPNYVLPLYPAAALLVAGYVEAVLRTVRVHPRRLLRRLLWWEGVVLAAAVPAIPIVAVASDRDGRIGDEILMAIPEVVVLAVASLGLVAASRRERFGLALRGIALLSVGLHLGVAATNFPVTDGLRHASTFANLARNEMPDESSVAFYANFSPPILYYLGGPIPRYGEPQDLVEWLSSDGSAHYLILKRATTGAPEDRPPPELVDVEPVFSVHVGSHDYELARAGLPRDPHR
jgi:4-amino-4-deoxy-L-arabinose transferase-like glycosyltransferase